MVKKVVKKKSKKSSSVDIKIKNVDKLMGKGHKIKCVKQGCQCGGVYGVGVIGALIYYVSTAPSFWIGVLGVLKALVWPAFVVFELLKLVGA